MGILLWLLIGLVAGWLASQVLHSPHGIFMDLVLGLVGSFIGGILASVLFGWKPQSLTGSLLVAFVGAVVIIGIHRALFGGRRRVRA